MELNRTNSPNADRIVIVSGTLNYGAVLVVTNIGPALQGGDSFQLFNAANITGSFTSLRLPALDPNLAWDTNQLSGGVLRVVQTVSPSVSYATGNGSLILSWPWDHTGWRLQAQTNSLAIGLGTNWFNVPNSAATNRLTLPIDQNNERVFYRLIYP